MKIQSRKKEYILMRGRRYVESVRYVGYSIVDFICMVYRLWFIDIYLFQSLSTEKWMKSRYTT